MRVAFVLLLAFLVSATAADKKSRPNIVLILADDLGWADLGCYGNKFNETPNIDRLATKGIRFNQFYAAASVCSPTRASIISGQHPARVGITAHIPGHWRPFEKVVEPPNALHLPEGTIGIAKRLHEAGYATAYFGKWHLGGKGFGPADYDFQTSFEFTGHSVPAARQAGKAKESKRQCEYLADLAIEFMEKNRARPFFIQISPYAVHIPLSTTPELEAKYKKKPKVAEYSCHPLYAGLLEELDTAVGRIMNALAELDLQQNTLIVFTSDNGGLEREMGGWPGTLNRPLRSEKGTLYEGGIRVPFIASWAGVIDPATTDTPAISTDLYPTFMEAAKVGRADNLDGLGLLPVLKGATGRSAQLKRDALFWHYPHYHHSRPSGAIRAGDWKLIEFFDTGEVELYNLRKDAGESHNVAATEAKTAEALRARLKSWRKEVCAQMPQENPAYDAARADEWWSRARLERTEAPGTFK